MILDDAINIMKVVRGILISFKLIDNSKTKLNPDKSFNLNEKIRV